MKKPIGPSDRRPRRPRSAPLNELVEFESGVITALRALDASGSRFTVSIGTVDATVSAELISAYRLAPGVVLDPPALGALAAAVRELRVFDRAVSLLASKARSTRQLSVALTRRGAERGDVARALERLAALGLLDDDTYARAVARTRVLTGRLSARRVEQDLQRRGIASTAARTVVHDVVTELAHDDYSAAREAADKRVRSLAGLDHSTARRRLHAWLARRGFGSAVIQRVLTEVLRKP